MRVFKKDLILPALGILAMFSLSCGMVHKKSDKKKSAKAVLELTGKWSGECEKRGFLTTTYQREEFDFSPLKNFDKQVIQHGDDRCKDENFRLTMSGGYDVTGDAEKVKNAKNVNFTVKTLVARAFTDKMAESLSDQSYCGIKDWMKNKDYDVTGKPCGKDTFKNGQVLQDIYQIDNNRLYFGNTLILLEDLGLTGRERPTSLDRKHTFVKK